MPWYASQGEKSFVRFVALTRSLWLTPCQQTDLPGLLFQREGSEPAHQKSRHDGMGFVPKNQCRGWAGDMSYCPELNVQRTSLWSWQSL